jgi:hypothetical protein
MNGDFKYVNNRDDDGIMLIGIFDGDIGVL